MIILAGGEKGGCCKSTTTVNMSGEFAYLGYKVAILDADTKTTAKNWIIARDALSSYINNNEIVFPFDQETLNEIPKAVMKALKVNGLTKITGRCGSGDSIIDTILSLDESHDILIIDVGGGDTEEFHMGLGLADFCICPLKPSIFDMETVPKLERNLKLAKARGSELVIRTLISDASTSVNSTLTRRFKEKLKDYEHLSNVLKTTTKNRDAYKHSVEWGLSVREWSDNKAKGEMSAIVHEIISIFNLKPSEKLS